MCLALNLLFFFSSYKALGTRVSQAPIKTKRGEKWQQFHNPEKCARAWYTDFYLAGGINFPIFGKTVRFQVIHGWNYLISLYIDCKMWSFYCCCLSGPLARRCVGNNTAQGAPTHPPATLTVSFGNRLGGYGNAFPRPTRLSWGLGSQARPRMPN